MGNKKRSKKKREKGGQEKGGGGAVGREGSNENALQGLAGLACRANLLCL